MAKHPTAKAKQRKVKTVNLTKDTIVQVQPAKGVAPLIVPDPVKGTLAIIPVTEAKIKDRSWVDRLLGR